MSRGLHPQGNLFHMRNLTFTEQGQLLKVTMTWNQDLTSVFVSSDLHTGGSRGSTCIQCDARIKRGVVWPAGPREALFLKGPSSLGAVQTDFPSTGFQNL